MRRRAPPRRRAGAPGPRRRDHPAAGAPGAHRGSRLLRCLADAGIVTVHAGAVTDGSGALVLAGPSGRGKSTLTLALVSDGMKLLSDEFALIDRDAETILPYRRSVHIRPGTPERVPMLNGLLGHGPRTYGGGIRWAVPQARLEPRSRGAWGSRRRSATCSCSNRVPPVRPSCTRSAAARPSSPCSAALRRSSTTSRDRCSGWLRPYRGSGVRGCNPGSLSDR